jgi:hypothetical protein
VQKALKDKGIEDMIAEARADNKDNDVEFMKPNSGKWYLARPIFLIMLVLTFYQNLRERKLYIFALRAARSFGVWFEISSHLSSSILRCRSSIN